ncbi:MAG: PLP-dependent aminotransferase family protein [Limnochordia bacterium]
MAVNWENLWSERARGIVASDIRDAFKLTEKEDVISFAGGFPSPEAFPRGDLGQLGKDIIEEEGDVSLQYGPTEGYTELRSLIAKQMREQGIEATADNILITSGSQQGLDLVSRVLLDPGDLVIVEQPGYIGGLGAINNYQGEKVGIPLDHEGLRVDVLAERLIRWQRQGRRPKMIYVVPNFQNPAGVTLSLERRRLLVSLAEEYGFVILEDNPYGELRFDVSPEPHMRSLDEGGNVIYFGSFSKVFVPGMRVGWITADCALIRKLAVAKQSADLCSNSFGQKLSLSLAEGGGLPRASRRAPESLPGPAGCYAGRDPRAFPKGREVHCAPGRILHLGEASPRGWTQRPCCPMQLPPGLVMCRAKGFTLTGRGRIL